MKAVIQRVKKGSVVVDARIVSEIRNGIVTLLGIEKGDTEDHLQKLIDKIINLRIFEDDQGKMNLSLKDKSYEHLIVSQFTLLGDTTKGRRPNFLNAEEPTKAKVLYERALAISETLGVKTSGGEFQAHMNVEIQNDGPVTFILEQK